MANNKYVVEIRQYDAYGSEWNSEKVKFDTYDDAQKYLKDRFLSERNSFDSDNARDEMDEQVGYDESTDTFEEDITFFSTDVDADDYSEYELFMPNARKKFVVKHKTVYGPGESETETETFDTKEEALEYMKQEFLRLRDDLINTDLDIDLLDEYDAQVGYNSYTGTFSGDLTSFDNNYDVPDTVEYFIFEEN